MSQSATETTGFVRGVILFDATSAVIACRAILITPALYILGAALVLVILFSYRPATTWPGLIIVLVGGVVYACLPRR